MLSQRQSGVFTSLDEISRVVSVNSEEQPEQRSKTLSLLQPMEAHDGGQVVLRWVVDPQNKNIYSFYHCLQEWLFQHRMSDCAKM